MRANVVSVAAFQLSEFVMRLPLDDVALFVCRRKADELRLREIECYVEYV